MRPPALSLVGSSPQNPVGTRKPGIYSQPCKLGVVPNLLECLVPWHHLLATGTQATEPGDSLPGWGWMAAPGSVSAAFQEYLQHLGLQDFPCGLGSWNKSRLNARRSPRAEPAGLEEAVPPGEETPETLLELLRDQHSPWALPPDCSPQDQLRREVAVLAPELLRGSRVFQIFKSLRILDKGVQEVDEGLLRFQQLEELILSANHISRVTSAHLPRTLKVLELCYNAVGDLQDLCAQPPPELQHLGLGYNRLCGPSQEKHFTVDFWPNLVSLDLSFNSLTDLLGLVSQLSTLQNLRILVLQGNPLALIPTYRGFLVDSLPKLSILDDIRIWPDERQQFHGLARQPGNKNPSESHSGHAGCGQLCSEHRRNKEPSGACSHRGAQGPLSKGVCHPWTALGRHHRLQLQEGTHCQGLGGAEILPGGWNDCLSCGGEASLSGQVLSWPVDADPEENTVTNKKEGQELKKTSAKDKQKKKKQQQPCELRSDPPIRSSLGTTRVTLETLLATEDLVATVCDFGILIPEKPPEPPVLEEKEVKKGKEKSKKPKAEKGGQASQKIEASSKGKGKNKDIAEVEEGQELQLVPLTVQFQMQLLRWPLEASTQSQDDAATASENSQ
ncbi:leucine-rich repeat-containing protein 43 isoform X2 [Cyanistes caeruleus]|uniref:leucine-rich repeat-containing protein 43 isoform X2 n=1 Tax=Cyanistes caeruleus TaxID=156563 RepID=UPI000CDA5487|nr:leucine-rich repeat-containing protein 43 isoform X2 [Cyanistes caeruleus]